MDHTDFNHLTSQNHPACPNEGQLLIYRTSHKGSATTLVGNEQSYNTLEIIMAAATETEVTNFHLSLNVNDLHRSIAFLTALLGVEPAKKRQHYAKFAIDDPPLVLSLEPHGRSIPRIAR